MASPRTDLSGFYRRLYDEAVHKENAVLAIEYASRNSDGGNFAQNGYRGSALAIAHATKNIPDYFKKHKGDLSKLNFPGGGAKTLQGLAAILKEKRQKKKSKFSPDSVGALLLFSPTSIKSISPTKK